MQPSRMAWRSKTMYRALRELTRPKLVRRPDHGSTRAAPVATMERYAEIVAALKTRTSNKKGCHLSTARAIRLLEEDGVETPDERPGTRPFGSAEARNCRSRAACFGPGLCTRHTLGCSGTPPDKTIQ